MKEEKEVRALFHYRKVKEGSPELAFELRSNDVVEQAMETSGQESIAGRGNSK